MKKEEQIINDILTFAKEENNVRAVMLNGSRLNIHAPKDEMQDYDVVFFVTQFEKEYYKKNQGWIKRFGDLVMLQQNEINEDSYIFLIQFKDGLRIDLRFVNIDKMNACIQEDTLSKILLDKDNCCPSLPAPTDCCHYVQKPSQKQFDECINELWWIQMNIAKGIWRDELPYAKYMFDVILMQEIITLISWKIGLEHEWQVNIGKAGKWLKRYLSIETYEQFIALYPGTNYEEMWNCLFNCGTFIRQIGLEVAEKLHYEYPMQMDENVTAYLKEIKEK
ncbi:MAG: aminoglycoside 6-adenylyltransferase [Bacillaceae bacterium]